MKPWKTWHALLVAVAAAAGVYALVPSCLGFIPDEDDTLCHALDEAQGEGVAWPDDEPHHWHGETQGMLDLPKEAHLAFDAPDQNPWWLDEAACDYMDHFLAGGDGWDEMGRQNSMSYDDDTGLIDTPLGRTYNAYANLVYSHSAPAEAIRLDRSRPLDDFDYYDRFLKWAVAWVDRNTFRINARCRRDCPDGCTIARTVAGTSQHRDRTDLYQTFYYDIDAIWRASTIVHEVRHAREGHLHTGGYCPRKYSCDLRWSSAGANTYEMLWLAAYFHTPERHEFITPARRARAEVLFSRLRAESFAEKPVKWNKERFVFINMKPEFYIQEGACSEDPDRPNRCLVLAN